MSKRPENSKLKKEYRKPQITQVELLAEEAVLAGCKTSTAYGPYTGNRECNWKGTLCNELLS